MDDVICVGCGRSFSTHKSLRAHEARCQASKALTAGVHRQHRDRKKSKKRKRTSTSHSPEPGYAGHTRFLTPDADFQPEVTHLVGLFIGYYPRSI